MTETLHKHDSLFSRAANHFRMAMTAVLALALGIGVNVAIFNLEGLRYSADVTTDPFNVFSRSDLRTRMAEAAAANDEVSGQGRGDSAEISDDSLACAPARARGCDTAFKLKGAALSLGDYLISLNLYRVRAGDAVALEGQ